MTDFENIQINAGNNLKKLIKGLGMNQKEFSAKIRESPGKISEICNGKKMPPTDFLLQLKQLHGIDIDDFLTSDINLSLPKQKMDEKTAEAHRNYLGFYYIYYLDPQKAPCSADEALRYGALYLYEISNEVSGSKFRCSACFDFESMDSVAEFVDLQKAMSKTSDTSDIEDLMINEHNAIQYEHFSFTGDFRLGKSNIYLSLSHNEAERALVVFPLGKENKRFRGAVGVLNFASISENPRPVAQNIAISLQPVAVSGEEIEECLLMDCPGIDCRGKTDELIDLLKDLYSDGGEGLSSLNDRRKKAIVESEIQYLVNDLMKKHRRRFSRLDETNEERWLRIIRDSEEQSNY